MVEDLEDDQREAVLSAMPLLDRAAIESSLGYAEDTAGRLMQREVMAAPVFWTVGDTIDHVRAQQDDLPELFFDIYVVDPLNKPVGGIPISWLLRASRDVELSDLMEPINEITVDQDQEEVAYIFEKYHLISAPVIDAAGRLVGQITVDDIVNIIQEENREDILRLAGVSDESRASGVFGVVRSRIPWLIVNLGTAVFASLVIGLFKDELEALVYLAILMPVVASIGGNAGTQALTVAVRALASRELTSSNLLRIVSREVMVGLFNGDRDRCPDRGRGLGLVRDTAAVADHRPGGVDQSGRGGAGGDADPGGAGATGPRPGGGQPGVRDLDHRFGRLPVVPRSGRTDPALGRQCASGGRAAGSRYSLSAWASALSTNRRSQYPHSTKSAPPMSR